MILTVTAMMVVGLALSALFAGMETGFYRATRLRLVLDALGGDAVARGLLALANRPALVVATALVGTNVANYLISFATVVMAEAMLPANPYVAELLAPLVAAPLVLVYGELLPKNMFLLAPNRLLRRAGPLVLLSVVVFFPFAGVLWAMSWLMGRLVGESREPVRLAIARRELRRILEEGHEAGILYPAQRSLARGIFAVAGLPVRRFLAAAGQVPSARADMTKRDALQLSEQHRTPVLPVESADRPGQVVGYVRVIDLRTSEGDQLAPIRPLLEIPEDTTHLAALMRLESTGEGIARVVDAAGATIGILSIDRLREPLFERGQSR